MKIYPAITKSVLLTIAAIILFMLPELKLPYVDKHTNDYFTDSISQAGVAYAVCRVINGSVSVIKESQIQIEPAGLGVSLAAGQILDPLDDMTERASDILVTAIISLGIQKIAYELCVTFAPPLIAVVIIALVCASFFKGSRAMAIRSILLKSLILVAVARLCLPASSMASSYLNDAYFFPQIIEAKDKLAMSLPEMERLKDIKMPEMDGVLGTIKNGFSYVGEKTSELGAALMAMVQNTGSMISDLLKLSYLYVAIFIVQVILLPLLAFWLLSRLCNALCGTSIPHILKNPDLMSQSKGSKEAREATGNPEN